MSSLVTLNALNVQFSLKGTLNRHDKKRANDAILSVFRATVCAHQGFIAQHQLLGNDCHKRLRIATSRGDRAEAKLLMAQLDRLHLDALKEAWQSSVQHLSAYFGLTHKSSTLPRMCIKGSVPSSTIEGAKGIVDLIREDGGRLPGVVPISNNSGFQAVSANGKHFLENNIPEAVKYRGYVNPRLNPRFSSDYKIPGRLSIKRYKSSEEDQEWIKCWDTDTHAPSPSRSCYKSTLIIPMTLLNNSLREEFFQTTAVGQDIRNNRLIYGFLCFDHPVRDYFHETDINVGYIFADLLSMYRITADALLTRSATYEDAKNL